MELEKILSEIKLEREKQDKKWGVQNHPSIPYLSPELDKKRCAYLHLPNETLAKQECELAAHTGELSWSHIVIEELSEAVSCENDMERRKELIQIAAVAVAWIECIDRNKEN